MSSDVGGEKGRQESNIDWLDDIKIFRKHYDCLNCLYKDQYRTCFELQKCNMVDYPDVGYIGIQEAEDCRTCSYGNAAGTCFGYCIKAILHEHRIKRLKNKDVTNTPMVPRLNQTRGANMRYRSMRPYPIRRRSRQIRIMKHWIR